MSSAANAPCLDHVIMLVPYQWLSSPPEWLSENFVISPGGRHADGKTENRLILFSDGSYLELIAFINDDESLRQGHWWDKPFGVVDYCLTTVSSSDFDWRALNSTISGTGSSIQFDRPQAGGRIRPDGVDISWFVTFPRGIERGMVPFWCHDATPRQRRVPVTAQNTAHPCGVIGVAALVVKCKQDTLSQVQDVLAAITRPASTSSLFFLHRLHPVEHVQPLKVILDLAQTFALSIVLQLRPGAKAMESEHHSIDGGMIDISFNSA